MNRFVSADSFEYSELSIEIGHVQIGSDVRIDPSFVTYHSGLPLRWQGASPVRFVAADMAPFNRLAKRVTDVVVSAAALVVLFPLLLIVAAIIKFTSPGTVLFRQAREGLNGEMFDVFKFRSMTAENCDVSGIAQTVADDPRLTRIGKFIRRTSIDELPQLFNVLRGDMSLVGPRPHVAGMLAAQTSYKTLVPYYDLRLGMRPGITGWAQANGLRGPTAAAGVAIARIDHDIAYIQNFSFWQDIKIILMTVRSEFVTGSAH